jgi:hypothetical protein
MARDCEPEIRDHVAMRVKRRAEIQRREAASGIGPTLAARSHYTNIQNVRSPFSKRSDGPAYPSTDNLPHRPRSHRGPLLHEQRVRSSGCQGVAAVSTLLCAWVFCSHRSCIRGVQLVMDFGVMDTTTCTPMNSTFVEIWHGESLYVFLTRTVCDRNSPISQRNWRVRRVQYQYIRRQGDLPSWWLVHRCEWRSGDHHRLPRLLHRSHSARSHHGSQGLD